MPGSFKVALARGRVAGFLLLALCVGRLAAAPVPRQYSYQVVHVYPHDSHAFTQGLVFLDGVLYESTGLNGHSSLRSVDVPTGKVLQEQDVPAKYFAEGLAAANGQLVQLTWQSHIGFVYDPFTFRELKTFAYPGEGWGLTTSGDGRELILSDGTSSLRFLDPVTFKETHRITVRDQGTLIDQLNELEYVHGQIYANVWETDRIAIISPKTGDVAGWVNLKGLLPSSQRTGREDVLNGIAYEAKSDRLFVTGKLWPSLFEIKLVPAKH